MGCYLVGHGATVGTRAGRFSWRGVPRRGEAELIIDTTGQQTPWHLPS